MKRFPLTVCGALLIVLASAVGCSREKSEPRAPLVVSPPDSSQLSRTFPTIWLEDRNPVPEPVEPGESAEACNGRDDDGDGLTDEGGCCFCKTGGILGDVNGDDAITDLDQACQVLVIYQKTTVSGSTICMDVNGDGLLTMDDVVENTPRG